MKRKWFAAIGLIVILAGIAILAFLPHSSSALPGVQLSGLPQASASSSFTRADGSHVMVFPADFGPHPDYQTEWWYYTGNLATSDGHHFGYQLTFFRRAIVAPDASTPRQSAWAVQQVYMAHFALTDVSGAHFYSFEKLSRGSVGLAGAQSAPVYQVWLEDWQVSQTGVQSYRLRATENGIALDLTLEDLKGPILQGDHGYSQKGADPGNASYYFSQTRLLTSGNIEVGNQTYQVNGASWMDHEFSTSALAPQLVGWDWFALQLSDGSELMLYNLRHADGSADAFSSGSYIAPDGAVTTLRQEDFKITVSSSWRSPHSKASYPSHWSLEVPSLNLNLDISPYLADQELNLSFTYWEGAVHFRGQHNNSAVTGDGYIEMTGYAMSMQGQF